MGKYQNERLVSYIFNLDHFINSSEEIHIFPLDFLDQNALSIV